jgi:hypothetical protein
MKLNFQGGASVLASRGGVCSVPKEHLRIARHFNAGSVCKWHQVPEGRPKMEERRFSRPSGTRPMANLFPALKRRAIFRKSLRDFALFAIASILLAAFGATAQTTNGLSDAEIRGRQLAQQLLEQRPATNFTQTGVLSIRDAKGTRMEIPMTCEIIVTPTNWLNRYDAIIGSNNLSTLLIVSHFDTQSNRYELFENERPLRISHGLILKMGMLLSDDRKMAPFANSDFWICDLGLEFLHWPEQKILRGDTARGRLCKVLESTNPDPSTNGYSRVLCWIDNETLGIVEAEAYDAKGKKLKEFLPRDFKKVDGQWQVGSMEIDNVQTGSRTRLVFDMKK